MICLLVLSGCQSPRPLPTASLQRGDYARARVQLARQVSDKKEGNYLLDRTRLALVTMADGYPDLAQRTFEEAYEMLRTQGINEDKTVASIIIHEGVRTWKGEPFEQAMAFFYYSAQQAALGHWDNARAAANNALFNLRDFGTDARGRSLDVEGVARKALEQERQHGRDAGETFINSGYAVRESNFTLGYIMNGIANQQLGRAEEANDFFAVAAEIAPAIRPLLHELRDGDYNTILLVSYGLGPAKVAYGEDNARVTFRPRTPSDARPLIVRFSHDERRHFYPVLADVNTMAADHLWNSLENVRVTKSALGSLFTAGGALATYAGAASGSDTAMYAGLGALAAGLFMKATAGADTRYLEVLPQRLYLVPLRVDEPDTWVELQVEGAAGSRLVLAGLPPPPSGEAQLRYVRLLHHTPHPPVWAASGRVHYGNPSSGAIESPATPFILGGHDVRPPDEAVLSEYQRSGYLRHMTLGELRELYRAEGIHWDVTRPGRHVLEGGRSLLAPQAGTTGFARLFGQLHPPYRPQSAELREISRDVTNP